MYGMPKSEKFVILRLPKVQVESLNSLEVPILQQTLISQDFAFVMDNNKNDFFRTGRYLE